MPVLKKKKKLVSVLAKIPKTSIFVPAALNKYPLPDFAHARPRPTQLPSRAIFKMLSLDTKFLLLFSVMTILGMELQLENHLKKIFMLILKQPGVHYVQDME